MRKEYTAIGKTIEAAVERGAKELGTTADKVTYEVIAEPKKGFFGFGEAPAKVSMPPIPSIIESPKDNMAMISDTLST